MAWRKVLGKLLVVCVLLHMLVLYVMTGRQTGRQDTQSQVLVQQQIPRSDIPAIPHLHTQCPRFSAAWSSRWQVWHNAFLAISPPAGSDVTLVTQLHGGTQLDALRELLLLWRGPVSVAVYLQPVHYRRAVLLLKRMLRDRDNVFVHVMMADEKDTYFPANVLHNIAVAGAPTNASLLLDPQFLPSRHAEARLAAYSQRLREREAMVLPAVTATSAPASSTPLMQALGDKAVLARMLRDGSVQDYDAPPQAPPHAPPHNATAHWLHAQAPYPIAYVAGYAPYVLMRTSDVARFPGSLVGWRHAREAAFMSMSCGGLALTVLPDVYLLHRPGALTGQGGGDWAVEQGVGRDGTQEAMYWKCSSLVMAAWRDMMKERLGVEQFPCVSPLA